MRSKAICYVLLAVLIAGHIAANAVWISRNRAPALWDQADYLALSQGYLNSLENKGFRGLWDAYQRLERQRAPLLPILAAPFYKLFGNSQSSAMFVNHLAVIVLCLSVFGIGRQIGGEWAGVIAAYLTMLTPATFGLSREFFVEFPMAAAVAASLYFALRAHRQPFYASVPMIMIFVAAGMLLKVSFPVFAGLPLAAILAWHVARFVFRRGNEHLWAVSKIGCGVMLALFIAATWYLPNMQAWTQFARENVAGARGAQYGAAPMDYLVEQARMSFLSYHLLALALLLLISAAAWITRTAGPKPLRGEETKAAAIAAATVWFLGALLVCLTITVKDVRLFFPAMPALAILLAAAYRAMARGWRRIPATALLLFPLAAFFNFSFHGGYDAEVEFRPTNPKVDVMSADYFLGLRPLTPYVHAPDGKTWHAEEIVKVIEENVPGAVASSPQGGVGVAVITNNPYLPPNWLRYVAARDYMEGKIKHGINFADLDYHDAPTLKICGERLVDSRRGVQFVVTAEGTWQGPNLYAYRIGPAGMEYISPSTAGPADMTHGDVMQAVTEILRSGGNKIFSKVGEIAINGDAKIIIYLNRYAGEAIPPGERETFLRLFDRSPGSASPEDN